MTAATSPLRLSRLFCAHITSYPSACSDGITLLKHEPSAQSPCANTMLGFVCGAIDLPLCWCAAQDGDRAPTRKLGRPPQSAVTWTPARNPYLKDPESPRSRASRAQAASVTSAAACQDFMPRRWRGAAPRQVGSNQDRDRSLGGALR